MRKSLWLGCLVLGLSWTSAFAEDAPMTWSAPRAYQWVFEAGYNAGGDQIASGIYGNTQTTWEVKTGRGYQGGLGLQYAFNPDWAAQFTVSYTMDSTRGSNGDIAFERYPVSLQMFYKLNDHLRVGGGWLQSYGAQRTTTGVAAIYGSESFKSDPGAIVQVMYFFKPYHHFKQAGDEINAALALRHVRQQYVGEKEQLVYRGEHTGLYLMLYF